MSSESATMQLDVPEAYRALSTPAVASVVLGVASVVTVLTATTSLGTCLATIVIPVLGILLGWRSLITIRRMPEEFTGKSLAGAGIGLCVFFAVTGIALASYTYVTEVPEGHARLSFRDLRPSEEQKLAGIAIPEGTMKLDGQRVFIKGYMRPSSQKRQLTEFLLVRDNNECCFGKTMPEYFDRVQVRLSGELRADYSLGIFKTAGTLHVHPENLNRGDTFPVFTLTADHLD